MAESRRLVDCRNAAFAEMNHGVAQPLGQKIVVTRHHHRDALRREGAVLAED
jgi:hypothetical protein